MDFKKGHISYVIKNNGAHNSLYRVRFGVANDYYQVINIIDDISHPRTHQLPNYFRQWGLTKKSKKRLIKRNQEYDKNRYFLLSLKQNTFSNKLPHPNIVRHGTNFGLFSSFKKARLSFGEDVNVSTWMDKNIPIIRAENLASLLDLV